MDADAEQRPVPEIESWVSAQDERPYYLVVSRLMPYKKVDVVLETFRLMPERRVVVVGRGPEAERLAALAPDNARLLSGLDDAQMRWLYAHARALIAPAFEDFGLTPLEAYAFGTPVLARRGGGYLDTVIDGLSGLFFDSSTVEDLTAAVREEALSDWDRQAIVGHGSAFSEARFSSALRAHAEHMLTGGRRS